MPEELKLYVRRIHRDEDVIAKLESAVKDFLKEVDEKVQQVHALSGNGHV